MTASKWTERAREVLDHEWPSEHWPSRAERAITAALEAAFDEGLEDGACHAACDLEDDIAEHLPAYLIDDGTGEEANPREVVEFVGDELRKLRSKVAKLEQAALANETSFVACHADRAELSATVAVMRKALELAREEIHAAYGEHDEVSIDAALTTSPGSSAAAYQARVARLEALYVAVVGMNSGHSECCDQPVALPTGECDCRWPAIDDALAALSEPTQGTGGDR